MSAKPPSNGAGVSRREAMRAASGLSTGRRLKSPALNPPASHSNSRTREARPRVFVSYARDDTAVVRGLVDRLRAGGAEVIWDQDFSAGTDFSRMICDAIDAAQAVIVVWSPASVRSRFVLDEAERSLEASKLVTTHVDKFKLRQVPLGFGRLHTIPVTDHDEIRRSLLKHGVVLRA